MLFDLLLQASSSNSAPSWPPQHSLYWCWRRVTNQKSMRSYRWIQVLRSCHACSFENDRCEPSCNAHALGISFSYEYSTEERQCHQYLVSENACSSRTPHNLSAQRRATTLFIENFFFQTSWALRARVWPRRPAFSEPPTTIANIEHICNRFHKFGSPWRLPNPAVSLKFCTDRHTKCKRPCMAACVMYLYTVF
jgi:hypothetical protein